MFRNIGKGCIQLLGGLGAGLAIIMLMIAWQVHKGPVSLGFLSPYVEQALNSGHRSFKLAFDDTTLTWAGWERVIELRVTNVRAVGENGTAIAEIPELSLALSGEALLRGELAPKYVELLGPDIRIRRDRTGNIDLALATSAEGDVGGRVASGLIGWLLKSPASGSPMSHLDTVRVTGATMTYEDIVTGEAWQIPVGHVHLERAAHGLLGEGSLLIDAGERLADVAINGSYHQGTERLDVTATFADIAPGDFAKLAPQLEILDGADVPLSGTLVLGVALSGQVDTVGFNVRAAAGRLRLPYPIDQTVQISSGVLRGLYDGRKDEITLDEAVFQFADATAISLPAPVDHTFIVRGVSGSGSLMRAKGIIDFTDISIALDGPVFEASGTLPISAENEQEIKISGELLDVPVDRIAEFWPASMGADARAWVTSNLSGGTLSRAKANIVARIDDGGDLQIESLAGTMNAAGVNVAYMPGMPPVSDTSALMTFTSNDFDIAIERGATKDVTVVGGTIHISGLQEPDQYADIDLRIEAPLRSALTLIDHEPLGFASGMGIDLESTSGSSEIDLHLHLLLAKDLTLDQIDVLADATLRDVSMDRVVLGRDVSDGKLRLRVDKTGMDVEGEVLMSEIPARLTWRENFEVGAPFKANFVLDASIPDIHKLEDLGIQAAPLAHEYIRGGVEAKVRYTVFDGRRSRVDVRADIARSELTIPMLDWRKAPGDPGRATVTILLENNLVKNVPSFEFQAGDMSVAGDIVYGEGGLGLERINFDHVQFGRTDISGAIISRPDGGWEVGLQGSDIDITPLWDRIIHDRAAGNDRTLPNLTVVVEFDRLWVDRTRGMTDVSGTFVHRHDLWRTVLLDGKLNGKEAFTVQVTPDETGNRVMSIKAGDAGESLRFLDLFDNMFGGVMEIRGRYDDAAPGNPLRGELRVANYRVRNAPLLTRVLSVMALTGILEAMTGEGLNFNQLEVPFVYREGELDITDAKATGTSLGFTASGTVYTHADVVNLQGTVVPVYALNSLLGNIPIIGDILTGTEEGGGVFAANFSISGPVEDPTTTVNPLSALTPGIFRNLFGAFSPEGRAPTLLEEPPAPILAR